MIKISILLAVCNGADSLEKSIGCLQRQSMKDIEIICVNDNSTDNSLEIIEKLKENDHRIKIVSFNENRGTICARKAGVMNASGEYIMFMDQDDEFEEYACEELYNMIVDKNVDIVNFRSRVIAVPPTTEKQKKWQEDFMQPYDGFLYNEDVFDYCFAPNYRDEKTWSYYTWNLWNKIYKANVCKRAMEECREEYVVNGDDIYVYMLIAYYAKSYYGDANGKFYHIYSLGSGLMGNHKLSLKRYYTLIRRATSIINEKIFFADKGEKYVDVVKLDECRALCGIVQRWFSRLEPKIQSEAYDMMCEYVKDDVIIAAFQKHIAANDYRLFNAVNGAKNIEITHTFVKTVCIYFSEETNIPMSVNMELIRTWRSHGYKIICITEEGYDLAKIGIIDVPVYYIPKDDYEYRFFEYPLYKRLSFIKTVLEEKHVDSYVYTGRLNESYIYDLLVVKNRGIEFLTDLCEYALYEKMGKTELEKYMKKIECSDGVLIPKIISADVKKGYKYIDSDNYEELFDIARKPDKRETELGKIIEKDDFKKSCKNLAVKRMFREGNFKIKIKIIIKKLIRLVGIKKNFYCDKYDDYIKLDKLN